MSDPTRRFIALLQEFEVKQDYVNIKLKVAPNQLGRAVGLLGMAYEGGEKHSVALRLVTRDKPGIAWRGTLKKFHVDDGRLKIVLWLNRGFDLTVMEGMTGEQIVLEYRDPEEEQGGTS